MFPPVKYSLNLPTAPAEKREEGRGAAAVSFSRFRRGGGGVLVACTFQTSHYTQHISLGETTAHIHGGKLILPRPQVCDSRFQSTDVLPLVDDK